MQRPQVSVYSISEEKKVVGTVGLPDVFNAPIRVDIVNKVHTSMRKNKRQPHAVRFTAGMDHSAESWGTGRAVARIPRVSGSGTSRSGQGAFGNMCRKGRMFAPIRIWRKWGVVIPKSMKRYSVCSGIAASAVTALVLARGHIIGKVKELPLVISNELESIKTPQDARKFMKLIGADEDRKRAEKKIHRNGKGPKRSRPYRKKRGPLVVFLNDNGIAQAFRNVTGVDTVMVKNLNVTQLCPGGHVGRFIIWTKGAFEYLNNFGSYEAKVTSTFKRKSGLPFSLPRSIITNSDIERVMQSDTVQNSLNPKKLPLKISKKRMDDVTVLKALNPYDFYEKRSKLLKKAYVEKYGIQKSDKMGRKVLFKKEVLKKKE